MIVRPDIVVSPRTCWCSGQILPEPHTDASGTTTYFRCQTCGEVDRIVRDRVPAPEPDEPRPDAAPASLTEPA